MDGKLGAFVRAEIGKRGLHVFEKIFDNGFRQTTSSTKPIATPADLKGFKIRVPVSPLWTSMFQALGASPASINFSEVYSALQTHIVDGQENPLSLIETSQAVRGAEILRLTNHMWDGFWLLANRRAFDKLPADAQAVVNREFSAAALDERADIAKLNTEVRGTLREAGLAFNEVDTAAFREALKAAGFYKEWRGKYGEEAWGVLESASARCRDRRARAGRAPAFVRRSGRLYAHPRNPIRRTRDVSVQHQGRADRRLQIHTERRRVAPAPERPSNTR